MHWTHALSTVVAEAMLESTVDPEAWKLELERVAPLLRFKAPLGAKEWRTHLEQTHKHITVVNELWPVLSTQISKIGQNMSNIAERISSKERHINETFKQIGSKF